MNISPNGEAVISETTSLFAYNPPNNFFIALLLTIFIEWILAFLSFRKIKLTRPPSVPIIIGNLVTVTIVWTFTRFTLSTSFLYPTLFITEVMAFVIEAIIYIAFYHKQIKISRLVLFSFVANVISFLADLLIF